jgi:chromosome segregation ATPase
MLGDLSNTEKAKEREKTYQRDLLASEKNTADELRRDIETKKQTLKDCNDQLVDVSRDLLMVKDERTRLSEEKKTLREQLQTNKKDLVAAETKHRKSRENSQAHNHKVETLRQNYDLLNQRNDRLTSVVKHIADRSTSKQNQIGQNTIASDDLIGKIKAEQLRYDQSKDVIRKSAVSYSELQPNVQMVEEKIQSQEKTFAQLKEQLSRQQNQFVDQDEVKAGNFKQLEKIEKNLHLLKEHHQQRQMEHGQRINEINKLHQLATNGNLNKNITKTTPTENILINKQERRLAN